MGGKWALLATLLMMVAATAGCFGGNDDEPTDDCPAAHDDHAMDSMEGMNHTEGDEGVEEGNESTLFFLRQAEDNGTANATTGTDDSLMSDTGTSDCPDAMEHEGDGMEHEDGNETANNSTEEIVYEVFVDADSTTGEAPFDVSFTFGINANSVSGEDYDGDGQNDTFPVDAGPYSWTFLTGDGSNDQSGTEADLPESFVHTYDIGGTFVAMFDVTFEDGSTASDNVTITVELPDERGPPEAKFTFGPTGGCVGDFGVCIAVTLAHEGQGVHSGIDGHFQALDDRYWGASLAVVMDPAQYTDSDCMLLNAAFEVIGEANGSSGACAGTVPANTAWIFLYPYAVPTGGMELTFTFP